MTARIEVALHDAADTPLGELVALVPSSSRVLLRYGLDYCCGGAQTLEDACQAKDLEVARVLLELREVSGEAPAMPWETASVQEIIAHILKVYHAPLREELTQLVVMAEKVLGVHGPKDPIRLTRLRDHLLEFKDELEFHMEKEEMVLFPWIATGRQPPPGPPIVVMEDEHLKATESLAQLRTLTDNFHPPEDACATWRNLYERLEASDHTLRAHIHLENHVLFPRATATT